jgi:hypothetical protein
MKPCTGMAHKGGSSFKWLIPVVAYGQVRSWKSDHKVTKV